MNTPKLDALLKKADLAERCLEDPALYGLDAAERIRVGRLAAAFCSPRLADIVLVMQSALTLMIDQIPWVQKSQAAAEGCLAMLEDALARAEQIAAGDQEAV